MRTEYFSRFKIFNYQNLIHFDIPKNASTSQKIMAVEPDNWYDDVPDMGDLELDTGDVYQRHSSVEQSQEFFSKFYSSYHKSLFIRNPIVRFGSALQQDYYRLQHENFMQIHNDDSMKYEKYTDTPEFIHRFEDMLADFNHDPSWEKLQSYLSYGKYNEYTLDFHLRLQTECFPFECLPSDTQYFDVDQNSTLNYRHWMFENNITNNKAGYTTYHPKVYHANNSSADGDGQGTVFKSAPSRKLFKDCVASHLAEPNSAMLTWIKDYYQADMEMYERLKPRCYTKGQESQS
jgi:hypothetical protein